MLTVPLGDLAAAYLDALASLDDDGLGMSVRSSPSRASSSS